MAGSAERLPLPPCSVDVVHARFAYFLTPGGDAGLAEVLRVLRPGGAFVYTVRHTGDAHYGTGVAHGDDIHEHGGFAVHFFSRELVDSLAEGWRLDPVAPFEEGELPRPPWRGTQFRPPRER